MASTSAYTTPAPTKEQIEKRDVGDGIRDLFVANCLLMALTTKGQITNGDLKESKGLLAKRRVNNPRFGNYTYTPLATTAVVTSLSSTTLTIASAVTIPAYYTVVNTKNGTTARIDSETSTTVKEITSFGSTAFSVTAGDVLLIMAPAYPQNSSSPSILYKSEDLIYNTCQQVRFPVAISDVAKNTPTHAVSDYWARLKKISALEGMIKTENTFLFGNRPSSGNTTSGGSALTGSFESTRGLMGWAANSLNAQGAMTPAKFRKDVPGAITKKVIKGSDKVIMFAGSDINSEMQEWTNDRTITAKDGTLEKFGITSTVFKTSEFEVELVMHDAFNQGSYANQAVVFKPEALQYCYMNGKDLKLNKNIQSNSTLGVEDEIEGMIGLGCIDGGESILKITNFL